MAAGDVKSYATNLIANGNTFNIRPTSMLARTEERPLIEMD
jgi:hypothetical protein